jgi:GNAT superfamily N-acetyltransferase
VNRFADIALARRIEGLGAWSQRAFVTGYVERFPELGAAAIDVAGGVAAFLEHDSPVNGAMGLGVNGEVEAEQIDALERFFRDRNARPAMAVAPLVDLSLTKLLEAGGWVASAFENVLVRDIDPAERFAPAPDGVEVRLATSDDDRELWAALVANGFSAPEDPSPAELRLGQAAVAVPGVRLVIGYVDGQPAGTGELHVRDGIGWLTGDTTLPQFRRRGVQGAIQRARLELARDTGCDLALTEALPGSASQRNMERLGFSVVYTRVEALAPEVPEERARDGRTE